MNFRKRVRDSNHNLQDYKFVLATLNLMLEIIIYSTPQKPPSSIIINFEVHIYKNLKNYMKKKFLSRRRKEIFFLKKNIKKIYIHMG